MSAWIYYRAIFLEMNGPYNLSENNETKRLRNQMNRDRRNTEALSYHIYALVCKLSHVYMSMLTDIFYLIT